ncbi:MAG: SDR family oxidoreductase [Gemmatimonadaceae bacterium]|nr:SDR family oxidoreductase [Gemmatimonadaceae bacterium]
MSTLRGQHVLVTGASRGIGRAVALALASAGATVHALARNVAALDALVAESEGRIVTAPCDVCDAHALQATVTRVVEQTSGRVDVLVNNAGVFPIASVAATSPDQLASTLEANVISPFRVLHALLGPMQAAGRGHVVTIGSVADRRIFAGNSAYSASKFGARALHEVLREEMVGTGIRTTLISPSATDTPIWDPIDPDNTPGFPKRASMLRAEDVAEAVLWAVTRPAHVNIDELRLSRA